ncbi:MAG: hypothetical protein C5B47_07355 [Verrucomicrobia bacterium]|nr:MAG: hypothetical protein C5B47_07355 [Verrucomicrobiota bacterium]
MFFEPFFEPDVNILGLYIPWIVPVTFLGFLCAMLLINGMERLNWTRFVWHLPLFFIAMVILFACLIGLICSP